ncbi:MAG: nucleotidyltransferase family protein [Chloroflexota bacterium]
MRKNIAVVILAAGLSRRMGTPKMLLPWGYTTVLGQVVSTFSQAGVGEIVVVTGGYREAVEAEVGNLGGQYHVQSIHNPNFESGEMLSSLQVGLTVLDKGVDATLVGLGDQPQLSLDATLKVIQAFEISSASLVVPSHNMRRGHPWLVQCKLWSQLLALRAPATMRDVLSAHNSDIQYVETDSTILKDLDTPQDYEIEKP